MWYVAQVNAGSEENICRQCMQLIDESTLQRCFVPRRQICKRYLGAWHIEEELMFPGYVFMVTDEPYTLKNELNRVVGLTELLGTNDAITPLTDSEVELLVQIGSDRQPVVMSTGIIEDNQITVTEGPLMGLENRIKKIDRHKRRAWIEGSLTGKTMDIQVGLEVVRKVS